MGAYPGNDFSALLDDLLAKDEADETLASPSLAIDLLDLLSSSPGPGPRGLAGEYIQTAERERIEDEATELLERIVVAAPPPVETRSIDPGDIARELGLLAPAGLDLDQARRDFAFANHPDRVIPEMRARAMIRMQIANRLIDEAKKARG